MAKRIGVATCRNLPEPDPDHQPLVDELQRRGVQPVEMAWDDPQSTACEVDLCVLRATWNYYQHCAEFLRWCQVISQRSRLINQLPVVQWNVDKHYLADLQQQGVRIVPTYFFEPDADANLLAAVCQQHEWNEFVIKPAISAASFCTRCFSLEEITEATGFLSRCLQQRAMLCQPLVRATRSFGERCVVWIDGQMTHHWIKHARYEGDAERVESAGELPVADQQLAWQTLRALPYEVRYARIDLMHDDHGHPMVSEVELIEPSLYFQFSQLALHRFVDMLMREVSVTI